MVTITSNTNDDEKSIVEQIQFSIDQYEQNEIGKDQLIFLAKSSGFIDNRHRKLAWNYLVDPAPYEYSSGKDYFHFDQSNLSSRKNKIFRSTRNSIPTIL